MGHYLRTFLPHGYIAPKILLRTQTEKHMTIFREERVFYAQQFVGTTVDLRSQILFRRFDGCEFINCSILIDHATEQLAFTGCIFKDCNIDRLVADEARALIVYGNIFERPLTERKADFDRRLAEVQLRARTKGPKTHANPGFRFAMANRKSDASIGNQR